MKQLFQPAAELHGLEQGFDAVVGSSAGSIVSNGPNGRHSSEFESWCPRY